MSRKFFRGAGALVLAAALTTTFVVTPGVALAAEKIGNGVRLTCDEAYYATTDYYGNLTEGSVVKSYATNGISTITDYGNYDEINNLTDGTEPVTDGSKTVFDFGDDAPAHFYFEGKTTKPFEKLPWKISMSYELNGVPTKAEDLAGKTGVVDINLNFEPNDDASEYAKNNYTLEAMAIFNQDDILSLEAEGAQVQLIGNLRVVLFVCLPGEENHFTISVGTEDFSFGGMTYLMVPATLSQLDMLSGLADDKDSIEDDYKKLNNSLDALIDSMGSMGKGLREAADGLDQLNDARKTISSGKGQVEDDIDVSLDDMSKLAEQLTPAKNHIASLRNAFDEITDNVNALHSKAYSLKGTIADMADELDSIAYDLDKFRRNDSPALLRDLTNLSSDLTTMKGTINKMKSTMSGLSTQVEGLTGDTEITVEGMTVSQIEAYVETAKTLHTAYVASLSEGSAPTNEGYIAYMATAIKNQATSSDGTSTMTEEQATAQATKLAGLYAQSQTPEYAAQIEQAKAVNSVLASTNMTVSQLKSAVEAFGPDTLSMLDDAASLCSDLGSLTTDLRSLVSNSSSTVMSASDLAYEASDLLDRTNGIIDSLDSLNKTVNKYVPEAKETLAECEEITETATTSLKNMNKFLKDLKNLLKSADDDLDQGTKKALSGLAKSLRSTAKTTDTAADVKSAKNDMSDIIERLWSDHTGDVDNLLNMDSGASPVSLTSSKNESPSSVQVLIRSQEIKIDEEAAAVDAGSAEPSSTFFGRIAQMFKDLWAFVTGIFS